MQQVIIVIHLMVVVALVVLILYQKSEGGALGIGGGGGLFTGRGQANALTRATGILGAIFFVTSIVLTVLPAWERGGEGFDAGKIIELKELPAGGAPATPAAPTAPAPGAAAPAQKKESIFEQLQRAQQRPGAAPGEETPAAAPPATLEAAPPVEAPAKEPAVEPEAKSSEEGAAKAPATEPK
jgi:preprotein translocase subunit SecG